MVDEAQAMGGLVDVARETWEATVAQRGRHAEWMPKLMLFDAGGLTVFFPMPILEPGDEVSTARLVTAAASEVVTPTTEWLCVTVDTYVSISAAAIDLVAHGPHTLRGLHGMGHPGVADALLLLGVDRAGHKTHRVLPYRVRGKRVHWLPADTLPVIPPDAQLGGWMSDALVAAMTKGGN